MLSPTLTTTPGHSDPAAPALPFSIMLRDGTWEIAQAPLAVKIKLEGFEGYQFFSHRFEKGFRVSEASTGLAVVGRMRDAQTFGTRGEAIGAAIAWLTAIGHARFVNTVEWVLARRESLQ